ncbi:35033_t:CDS:10 [Gigaspora margarita]|uniref:35033_t:CDS:1 n=1 Tax=Gigaspora margarita TaxID=4874 RepID=A0ABN7UFU8_GIGMA|nr:35033_t:CDS:10 [Gigaspora margarita]
MYQMLKQFDDFMPQERGELDSAFGATEEYLQNINERLRSRVVIVTMFPHILLTIFLWLWRSSDIVSDRYLTYSIATSVIFIELRTPIHGILASTEILCSSSLSSAQRALISAIQNSGINVIHMADHILRVAKTEDLNVLKGITHETIPFDLYKATEQIADGMELLFETENIHFDFEYKIPLKQSMYIVTFCVENHFKEKTDTENIFTIKLIIVTKQKSEDYGESSESNSQITIRGKTKRVEYGVSVKLIYTLTLLMFSDDDTNPTNNTIPIPLRYLSKKIEDADPRILLKIGIIRTDNSLITRKIISFLQEFKMKFNIITPNDIPLCDINVLIFDSAEADNEMIETICRNVRNTRILIISITLLLKHLIICETAQKVGLEDNDIYFVAKPLTIVKFWNSLISAAEAIKKRSYNIENITGSVQGEICETISETNEESREHSNPHQSETSEESREHSNPHQGETSEESREDSIPHQGETSEESREDSIPHQGEIS